MIKKTFESQKLLKVQIEKLPLPKFEKIPDDERKVKRLIFHNTEFLEYELTLIEFLKEKMMKKNINIPRGIDDGTLLKYLYSSFYDQEKACEALKEHFEWLEKSKKKKVNEDALIFFQNNFINLVGRDKTNKPIILFDLKQLELKDGIQTTLLDALEVLFSNAKKHLLQPGMIEKWTIILDFTGKDLITSASFDFNIIEFMISLIKILGNFPETLEKVFLINPSKEFVNIYWSPLESKKLIPNSFKEKLICFSDTNKKKIPGFPFQFFPLRELMIYCDASIIPEEYGGKSKKFPNFLNGLNLKQAAEDYLLHFDELIRDLQNLEVEKKRKQAQKDILTNEIIKEKAEINVLLLALKYENEVLRKQFENKS